MYLEDQTEDLVQAVQALVSGIRSNAGPAIVRDYIGDIAGIVENVVSLTTTAIEDARSASLRAALREKGQPVVDKLSDCRTLLLEASTEGDGIGDPTLYKTFTSKLPPMAFEIARETKVGFSLVVFLLYQVLCSCSTLHERMVWKLIVLLTLLVL